MPLRIEKGSPHPLGATPDADGVNFSIFSGNATGVELLLFAAHDASEPFQTIPLDPFVNKTFHFWHVFVRGLGAGAHYAYRVDGPDDPGAGHRFNRNKVLIDPYARGNTNSLWSRAGACGLRDNVATSMRSVVIDTSGYDWEGDRPLDHPIEATILYEMHVRGFTRSPSSGVAYPGTFDGVIEKIPYLRDLGITAVELLPVFDLREIHPKEGDIGMGWTTHFCASIPNWRAPENLDRSIDRFLLNTLAYGHIGWLVEEEYGWSRVARSYYMLQPVQARYGVKAPTDIRYWGGQGLVDVSTAIERDLPRTRRQLRIDYPGGLRLWLNDHGSNSWRISDGTRGLVLPPAGWAAATAGGEMSSYSGLVGTNRVDFMRCPEVVYLDGRGQWFETAEGGSSGSMTIFPRTGNGVGVIRFSGEGEVAIKRPFQTRGALRECRAWDAKNQPLAAPAVKDDGLVTRIAAVPNAIRYELRFETADGKR